MNSKASLSAGEAECLHCTVVTVIMMVWTKYFDVLATVWLPKTEGMSNLLRLRIHWKIPDIQARKRSLKGTGGIQPGKLGGSPLFLSPCNAARIVSYLSPSSVYSPFFCSPFYWDFTWYKLDTLTPHYLPAPEPAILIGSLSLLGQAIKETEAHWLSPAYGWVLLGQVITQNQPAVVRRHIMWLNRAAYHELQSKDNSKAGVWTRRQ